MDDQNFLKDKFAIDQLLKDSWKYRNSKDFVKFFEFIARFDHYSRFNTMLVYIQNKDITFFGGVSYWEKRFNRTVVTDARPYIILAPMSPIMFVYDVYDTKGDKSVEDFIADTLETNIHEVKGKIGEYKIKDAYEKVKDLGIKLSWKPLSYFNSGYITTIQSGKLEIALKSDRSHEQNTSVLVHELAHLFLGHTGHEKLQKGTTDQWIKLPQRDLEASARELEAETVSFLVCKKLGLAPRSAAYLAGYMESDEDLTDFSYEAVIKTADKIEKTFF